MLTNRFRTLLLRFVTLIVMLCTVVPVIGQVTPLPDEVKLTYITSNKPLGTVLQELSSKSGVPITYVAKRIPINRKVTINAVNQPLGIILKAILRDKRCRYDIIGNQIVINRDNTQDRHRGLTISGYVRDQKSGESLVGANVYLFDKTKGTQTNEYGFYSFTMDRGTKRIYYSYLGYGQEVKEVFLEEDTIMNLELVPDAELNQIVILDDVENQEEPQTYSQSKLNVDRITKSNSLLGEGDIIRLIGQMPGVDGGSDGVGGMNVRGGSADQNLILLDGVPVYNISHALGLFSIFNTNVIKNATLIKGNIPARYGGRLSSVLDVRTRDGNTKKLGGEVSLSALAVKASLDGPIGKNGSSYLVSARRTIWDPFIDGGRNFLNELNDETGSTNYFFSDLNAKLNFKLGKKNTLHISGYWGQDAFNNDSRAIEKNDEIENVIDRAIDWTWGNKLASIKLTTQYSNKLFGRLLAYTTNYNFDSVESDDFTTTVDSSGVITRVYQAGHYKSAISDISLKYDLDYIPSPTHLIRAGIGMTHHDFSPGLVSINNSDNVFSPGDPVDPIVIRNLLKEAKLSGMEYFGYFEDDISLGYASTLNIGIHANYTTTDNQTYFSIQPRIAFLAKWDGSFFKAGVSRLNQYLHLLSSNGLGLPTDIWLPSTDNLAPEKSWVASAGVGYYTSKGYRFGIEGYYKIFDALTTFDEGGISDINNTSNWEDGIPVGTGSAYGLETYLNKIIGRTTWNANYTLAFAFREFEDLTIDDEPFPFKYNRRHNAKLGLLHKLTMFTEFTLNWNLSSGNPITSPSNAVFLGPDNVPTILYECKNCGNLPVYNRVDIGFNFYNKYSWGRTKMSIGVFNVFNKKNPFYQELENSIDNPKFFRIKETSAFQILPTIGYSVSF